MVASTTPGVASSTQPTAGSGFSFAPSYQDYQTYYGSIDPSSYANSAHPELANQLTQDQWGGLSSADQWQRVGQRLGIDSSDPRYAGLIQQMGGVDANGQPVIVRGNSPFDAHDFANPNNVLSGDGVQAYLHDNLTPGAERGESGEVSFGTWATIAALAAAGIGGAGLLAGLQGGAGGLAAAGGSGSITGGGAGGLTSTAAETGAFDVGGSTGFGGAGFDGSLTGGLSAAGAAPAAASTGLPSTSSALSTLNQGRSILGTISALTGGGSAAGGSRVPGSTDTGSNGVLGSLLGILGLGAEARSTGLIGGGVGTPSGAQAAGSQAASAADPFGASGLRTQAQGMLTPNTMMQLLGLNSSGGTADIASDPGYQFARDQGISAINQGDAAQGTLRSGNRLTELQQYGTGLASQYETQFKTNNLNTLGALGKLAGNDSSSPATAGNDIISGFTGATNLQNAGTNSLLGGLLSGSGSSLSSLGGSLTSLLSSGASGVSSFLSSIFGSSGGGFDTGELSNMVANVGGGSISDDLFGGDWGAGW